MEEYTNLIDGLKDTYSKADALGNLLKSISDLTDDVEMKAIVLDIANSAYNLALDIKDAGDTYAELQQEEVEDLGEDDLEPVEPEE